MGFFRLTPANAKATRSAGIAAFVYGGLGLSAVGLGGLLLAAFRLSPFAWEAAALAVIGAVVAATGTVITSRRMGGSQPQR